MAEQKKLSTKYFNVFYFEEDCNIINQIISLIDGIYEEIVREFNLNRDVDKFNFYLCPDVSFYKKQTGKTDEEYEEWMVGNAQYEIKQLCILSPNAVTDRSYEDMLKVIKHEIVHIAFDQLNNADETSIMIAEGIAVGIADQIEKDALTDEEYPEAAKLSDEEYFYDNAGYEYAGVYVLYLIKKIGTEAFKRIYADEEKIEKYLYEGFEKEAVEDYLAHKA